MADKTTSSDRIRALERGLTVIEHLSTNGRSTLADLRNATGLGNATLLRILGSLQHRGWVRRNLVEGHFELSHTLGNLLGENARAHPLAEFAASLILDLKAREAGWPTDVAAVIAPGKIEIIESTRMRGPMAPTRTGLGLRPSLVLSAHGRAVLAFSKPEENAQHMRALAASGTKEERMWIETGRLAAEVARTKERGYGLREPMYWQPPFDPGPEVGALAVPIFANGRLHGSVSVLWIADDVDIKEILRFGALKELQQAALLIGRRLEHAGVEPPF